MFKEIWGWLVGGGLVGLMTLVEVSKIKINPWSAIWKLFCRGFHAIGRALNGEVLDKIEGLDTRIDKLEKSQEHAEAKAEEREAKACRLRILRFDDELQRGCKPTKEHITQMLDDVIWYRRYCDEHKDFPDGQAIMAGLHIENDYNQRWKENNFLEKEK